MKHLLIITLTILFVFSPSAYAEKGKLRQMGSYFGEYPYSTNNVVGQPHSDAMWAGDIYLIRQKQSAVEYVVLAKLDLIKSALTLAKRFANKKSRKKFAIHNMHFQVLHTETKVEVYFDCDLIAFN